MYFVQYYASLFSDVRLSTKSDPIICSDYEGCVSYLFPGALAFIIPSPFSINNLSNADVIQVLESPGLQLDFWDLSPDDTFQPDTDCRTWGSNDSATQICISSVQDHFIAGTRGTVKKPVNIQVSRVALNLHTTVSVI
jgi:hypothetical protein